MEKYGQPPLEITNGIRVMILMQGVFILLVLHGERMKKVSQFIWNNHTTMNDNGQELEN